MVTAAGPADDEREGWMERLEWLGDWRPDDWDLAAVKKEFDQ